MRGMASVDVIIIMYAHFGGACLADSSSAVAPPFPICCVRAARDSNRGLVRTTIGPNAPASSLPAPLRAAIPISTAATAGAAEAAAASTNCPPADTPRPTPHEPSPGTACSYVRAGV